MATQPLSLQDSIAAWLQATRAQESVTPDFSVTTTPAEGLVDMTKPSQPKVDWAALALESAKTMALRVGTPVAGGVIGSLAGPVGTFAGIATGAALGDEMAQQREVASGQRDAVNPLEMLAAGATAPIPGGTIARGTRLLPALGRAALTAQPANLASSVALQMAEGQPLSLGRTAQDMGASTLLGGGIGLGIRGAQALPGVATRVAQMPAMQRLAMDETGAIRVHHASPHKFDKFDLSKVGTGEGAQAFGHGLYFAQSKDTANWYLKTFKDQHGKASLYEADINVDESQLVDWDKPMAEQSPEIAAATRRVLDSRYGEGVFDEWSSNGADYKDLLDNFDDIDGPELSKLLKEAGVPGIKYLDRDSRYGGSDTRNIVVFDDSLVNVVGRSDTDATVSSEPGSTVGGQWSRIAGENLGPNARGVLDDVPVPASMTPEGIPAYRLKENTERAFAFLDRHGVSDDSKRLAKDIFVQGEDAFDVAHRRMGLTWAQTDALASQIVPDVRLPKGSVVSPEEVGALRRATFGLIDRASGISEDVSTLNRLSGALAQQSPEAMATQAALLEKHGVRSPQALLLKEKAAVEEAITAQRSLMGVRSEMGRGLNYLKTVQRGRNMDDADFLAAALKGGAVGEDALKALREMPTPDQRYRFLRGLRKPGSQDYWRWYAMTAYLSGPVTQWRNLRGNLTNFGAESVLVDPVAAGIDRLRNPGNRTIVLKESQAAAAGLSSGFLDGTAKALQLFKNGFTEDDVANNADLPPEVFGGALLPNVIGRSMGAVDQFFRTVGLHMELHREAMLSGVKQGLQGEELAAHVKRVVDDPTITPALHKRAQRYAATLTFQDRNVDNVAGRLVNSASGIGKALDTGTANMADLAWESGLNRLGKMGSATYGLLSFPPSVIVAPFINTPFNILKRAAQYGGGLPMAAKGGDREAMRVAARGAIGMASLGVAAGLYQQGLLTGAPPTDPAERDAFYATKRPYAIRIGDQWHGYQDLGPLGMALGATANYMQTSERNPKDSLGAFGQMAASTGKMLVDSSFLRGMYNLLDAVVNADRSGDKLAARTATGLLPAAGAMRFVRDQIDPTLRAPETAGEQVRASLPGLSETVAPRIDFAGQEVARPNTIAPTPATEDPLRQELLRLRLATSDGYLRDPMSAAKGLNTRINTALKKQKLPAREVPREALVRYGKKYGRISAKVLGQIVQSDAYQRLDDEGKRTMIERAKDVITKQVDAVFIREFVQ